MITAPVYFGTKCLAYMARSFFGLRLLRPLLGDRIPRALALGFIRLLMGFGFGLAIWIISTAVYEHLQNFPARSVFTYVLVYVPVRWIEWSILQFLFDPPAHSADFPRRLARRPAVAARRHCDFLPR